MATETVPKLVLINPLNEASIAESSLAPRLAGLQGKRIGLLDNSKNKAGDILDAVTAILHAEYGFTEVKRFRKPSASKPADPEMIHELASTCDLVVAGVGD